jgi:hypothetical protein
MIVGAGLLWLMVQYNPLATVKGENINSSNLVGEQMGIQKTGTTSISIVAKNLMPAVVGITATINPTSTS